MFAELKIGFLGLGKMGSAIALGLLKKSPDLSIYCYDIKPPDSSISTKKERIKILESPAALEKECDLILLCVKPQDMKNALTTLLGNKRYISIAAGTSIKNICGMINQLDQSRISRVMPNLPAIIGKAVSGIFCSDTELAELTRSIFDTIGYTIMVGEESELHVITGLSGSGPAFVFAFIQGMAEGGVLTGLSYEKALNLAAHTIMGSAALIIESGEHPGVLRNRVTSPGGTTIAGLDVLEKNAFQSSIMQAVTAAVKKSQEMGRD